MKKHRKTIAPLPGENRRHVYGVRKLAPFVLQTNAGAW